MEKKIYKLPILLKKVAAWKLMSNTVVFTNGCFDILHKGHVTYLQQAKALGNKLIIGLNSDASVKKLNKGTTRPIQDEESRAIVLASLTAVDAVILFEEETPFELIKAIQPDMLVKGGDWKSENIVGSDIVLQNGGKVESIRFVEGYSTTAIEEKIKNN